MKGNIFKPAILLLAILAIRTMPCYAEDIDLDEIVVTASRTEENYKDTSRSIDIITSEDIQSIQAQDLGDVLNQLSSVEIISYGGLGSVKTIKMRGSTASQVLVLVDGRPINSPRDGEVDLSAIPLENIERIEVMHGSASSLYGSSAMGGTVQIITKDPPKEDSRTEIMSSFGTFRTYQERLTQGQKLGKFGYLLSGGYQSSQGSREDSEFDSKDFSLKMDYDISDNQRIWVNTGFYTSFAGTPGPTTWLDLDDKQKRTNNLIDLNWRLSIDELTNASIKLYNDQERLKFIEDSSTSYTHTTRSRGIDIQLERRFNDFYKAISGINYILNLNNSTSSAKHKYSVFAWYINNEFNVSENLKTDLGLRLDDYSNFGLQASPSLSATYKFNEKNRLHGLISRSFRAPTFNDLYWPDEGWAKGNPGLQPEIGTSAEVGITSEINRYFETGLTYYRNYYKDLIQWASDGSVWMPSNVSCALINGIEWENRFLLSEDIEINVGYTYQIAKDTDTHKFLIYQPEHKTDFSIKHHNVFGCAIALRGGWNGLRYDNASNTTKMDGFFTLGFSASRKLARGTTFYLNIDNALNKKYQSVLGYPMPGFDLTTGVKIEF